MAANEMSPETIVDKVLERARKLSGAEVSVSVTSSHSGNTRFAVNHITTAGEARDTRIGVTVVYGKRRAAIGFNQLDAATIDERLGRVARMAKLAPEDPEHMPFLAAQKYGPAAPAFDAATAEVDAVARAEGIRAALAAAESAGVVIAGYLSHVAYAHAIGSSAGLRAAHRSTHASVTMTARTPDGGGSGWAGLSATSFAELRLPVLARTAVDKAVASKQPRHLEAGRYTVVLEPPAVADLAGSLLGSLDAREVDEGRSPYTKAGGGSKLGDKLLADWITLRTDPADAATADAPFDGEGLPRGRTDWFSGGKLTALQLSRFWAQKTGGKPTAHPGRAQLLGGSAASREELIKGVDRGVLITRFWYIGELDPKELVLTGLTRDGTFLIEKGEVVGPVNAFRWNESPLRAFANADAATRESIFAPADDGDSMRAPALRTHDFNLASISDAV